MCDTNNHCLIFFLLMILNMVENIISLVVFSWNESGSNEKYFLVPWLWKVGIRESKLKIKLYKLVFLVGYLETMELIEEKIMLLSLKKQGCLPMVFIRNII